MSGSRYQLADTVLFHYVWYQWDSVFVHSHFSVGSHSYGQCFYCFGFLDSSPQTKEDILSCHQLNSCRPSCWIHCNTWDRSGSCSSATKQNQSQGRLVQFIGIHLCLFISTCVLSCTYFIGTCFRFDLAASTSCNKHYYLHIHCGYRLVRWDSYGCILFSKHA